MYVEASLDEISYQFGIIRRRKIDKRDSRKKYTEKVLIHRTLWHNKLETVRIVSKKQKQIRDRTLATLDITFWVMPSRIVSNSAPMYPHIPPIILQLKNQRYNNEN